MKNYKLRKLAGKGFTLIEMLVVVVVIGTILAIAIPTINNMVGSQATATAMTALSQNIAKSASVAEQTIRIPTNNLGAAFPTGTPLAGVTMLDVVARGDAALTTAAQRQAYSRSGLRSMSDAIEDRGAAGYWVEGFRLNSIATETSAGGSRKLLVNFLNVNDNIVESIWSDRVGTAFVPGTAVTTGPVRYAAASNGMHATLTLSFDL